MKKLFTAWKDVGLTDKGGAEAKAAGQELKAKGLHFDIAYTSDLSRAQNTLKLILDELGQPGLETIRDQALNDRDYGELTGMNKHDARKKWGEEPIKIPVEQTEQSAHMKNFLECVRSRQKPVLDVETGMRAQVTITMAVQSYREGRVLYWDEDKMRVWFGG